MLPANNSELAAQIGPVRELVSRNLSRLQAEGLIQVDSRNLEILSLKRLEAELDDPEARSFPSLELRAHATPPASAIVQV